MDETQSSVNDCFRSAHLHSSLREPETARRYGQACQSSGALSFVALVILVGNTVMTLLYQIWRVWLASLSDQAKNRPFREGAGHTYSSSS